MSRLVHEQRVLLTALGAGFPAVLVAMTLLWTGDYTPKVKWTLSVLVVGAWIGLGAGARELVAQPLRTIANLLEAMREGDYSIRARGAGHGDALGDVIQQVNAMGTTLRAQRLGALEATTLLRKVMEEIDVAVFAFDSEQKLRLVNRAGEKLVGQPAERILDLDAKSLGLADCLEGEEVQTIRRSFRSGQGRWGINRTMFREGGLPHTLLVITDLTRALREEELAAWQRIVRVLGHELNNSLAPIKSIAGSLESLVTRTPRAEDWEDDMKSGLRIIASRADSLSRFMSSYARLAKLPRPQLAPLEIGPWIESVVRLETRMTPALERGEPVTIQGDRDQLDQVLINLIKNAVEAAGETQGSVTVGWAREPDRVSIWVRDTGPGLANTSNLFVPFFTTKPGGSGIGLVLCRQIVEAHDGSIELRNRAGAAGCEARITLPVA